MKYSTEEKKQALEYLSQFRGRDVYAIVNSVSRSGMSRRIELYAVSPKDQSICRIGYYIAKVCDMSYNVDKGGISRQGCGMDMIYDTISDFNIQARVLETGDRTYGGSDVYQSYFFNASYRSL